MREVRVRLGLAALVLATGVTLGMPGAAGAATTVGQVFAPTSTFSPGVTLLQVGSPGNQYSMPSDGVVTSLSFQAGPAGPTMKFKIARPVGGNDFRIVGESPAFEMTANQVNTFEARFPVRTGDVLGFLTVVAHENFRSLAGYTYAGLTGDLGPGQTATFSAPIPNGQLDVGAVLEPDCDNDGFGDETQDQDTLSCPPAPTATITSGPADKVKTKKKKVNVTFEFASNEQGSTFNCVLDGQQEFKACTSPLTVTVKKGEHTFSVDATDAGGNKGAAATDTFKVKRKKKK